MKYLVPASAQFAFALAQQSLAHLSSRMHELLALGADLVARMAKRTARHLGWHRESTQPRAATTASATATSTPSDLRHRRAGRAGVEILLVIGLLLARGLIPCRQRGVVSRFKCQVASRSRDGCRKLGVLSGHIKQPALQARFSCSQSLTSFIVFCNPLCGR